MRRLAYAGVALPVLTLLLVLYAAISDPASTPWGTGDDLHSSVNIGVVVDIMPESHTNSVNVKRRGLLGVAILGTERMDVTTIDPASIRLDGVAPVRSRTEIEAAQEQYPRAEGYDHYGSLILKFHTQDIVRALGQVSHGEHRSLLLTGNLLEEYGGAPISGEGTITVIKKKTKKH